MSSTQHTGVVVSTKDADAFHAAIKKIMAERALNFGDAINWYIKQRQSLLVLQPMPHALTGP